MPIKTTSQMAAFAENLGLHQQKTNQGHNGNNYYCFYYHWALHQKLLPVFPFPVNKGISGPYPQIDERRIVPAGAPPGSSPYPGIE